MRIYSDDVPGLVDALASVGALVVGKDDKRAQVEIRGLGNMVYFDIVHKGSMSPYDANYYDDREPGN